MPARDKLGCECVVAQTAAAIHLSRSAGKIKNLHKTLVGQAFLPVQLSDKSQKDRQECPSYFKPPRRFGKLGAHKGVRIDYLRAVGPN